MDTFIIAFILLSVSLAIAFMIRSNNTTKYGLLHESSVIYESGFKKFKEGSKAKIQINEQGKVIIFFSEDNYIILEPLNIIENTIKK